MKKGTRYSMGYVGDNAYGASVAKDSGAVANRPMKPLTTKSRGVTNDYSNEVKSYGKPMSNANGSKYKG